MSYEPREFWEDRLSRQFDLRGTGETGLSLAYNRACYALRREVLTAALAGVGFDPRGRRVLDVGCGTGYFVEYYLERGADVTGLDLTETSVERLRASFPAARFVRADVGDGVPGGGFDLVNVFDVLFHVTDDARWEAALRNLANALAPGGLLAVTDTFVDAADAESHNRPRSLGRYERTLASLGLERVALRPTAVLLNRELGALRFLNRAPGLLLALDRTLIALGAGRVPGVNQLLLARRAR